MEPVKSRFREVGLCQLKVGLGLLLYGGLGGCARVRVGLVFVGQARSRVGSGLVWGWSTLFRVCWYGLTSLKVCLGLL